MVIGLCQGQKTELIWFGSKQTLDKVSRSDLTLQLDSGTLNPVEVVRNLGVRTA